MSKQVYYVYVHYDPDTSKPMYVGMGQKGRALNGQTKNVEW